MSNFFLSFGGAGPHWMQHNMPWLAVLALVFGVWRDEPETAADERLDG